MSSTDEQFVFNVVWTGTVFSDLRHFTDSLIDHSGARFRYVANGCPPDQVELMADAAGASGGRIVEALVVSTDDMLRHGDALDLVRTWRDDGDFFCLMDPDILATGPFLARFHERLAHNDVVTSGTEVWSADNLVPQGHLGVAGEHFFDRDGYVFGSPHMAIYRAGPLAETTARWGVGFGSGGAGLSDKTRSQLATAEREFLMYDTGKIVNILLQEDGFRLEHFDHPALVHIGGMAHYLSPPAYIEGHGGEPEPDWSEWKGMEARYAVARYTAGMLRALSAGRPAPPAPEGLDPDMEARLTLVRREISTLINRYGACSDRLPTPRG